MHLTLPASIPAPRFNSCADAIATAATELARRDWTPATSSNFSMRVDDDHAAITISGRDKGRLGREDIMLVDLDGQPVGSTFRPSAETGLHTQLYRRDPAIAVVLHTHSRTQSVASRYFSAAGMVELRGWELQKAIRGHTTHDDSLRIPVFPNTQHMPELEQRVEAWLMAGQLLDAYLIDGHGIYTWGRDMAEAMRHLEAIEFLLACELDLRRLAR